MATQTQYAWAAGFFDGEGCVSAHIPKGTGKYITLRLVLVQKDIRPLEEFKRVFDCTEKIGIVTRSDRANHYYRLMLSGNRAASALQKMLPYLILKREVAQVALDLQAHIERLRHTTGCIGLTESEWEYRRALVGQIQWLNTGRWAAATTKSGGPEEIPVCDSLICIDDKDAEVAEMATRLN